MDEEIDFTEGEDLKNDDQHDIEGDHHDIELEEYKDEVERRRRKRSSSIAEILHFKMSEDSGLFETEEKFGDGIFDKMDYNYYDSKNDRDSLFNAVNERIMINQMKDHYKDFLYEKVFLRLIKIFTKQCREEGHDSVKFIQKKKCLYLVSSIMNRFGTTGRKIFFKRVSSSSERKSSMMEEYSNYIYSLLLCLKYDGDQTVVKEQAMFIFCHEIPKNEKYFPFKKSIFSTYSKFSKDFKEEIKYETLVNQIFLKKNVKGLKDASRLRLRAYSLWSIFTLLSPLDRCSSSFSQDLRRPIRLFKKTQFYDDLTSIGFVNKILDIDVVAELSLPSRGTNEKPLSLMEFKTCEIILYLTSLLLQIFYSNREIFPSQEPSEDEGEDENDEADNNNNNNNNNNVETRKRIDNYFSTLRTKVFGSFENGEIIEEFITHGVLFSFQKENDSDEDEEEFSLSPSKDRLCDVHMESMITPKGSCDYRKVHYQLRIANLKDLRNPTSSMGMRTSASTSMLSNSIRFKNMAVHVDYLDTFHSWKMIEQRTREEIEYYFKMQEKEEKERDGRWEKEKKKINIDPLEVRVRRSSRNSLGLKISKKENTGDDDEMFVKMVSQKIKWWMFYTFFPVFGLALCVSVFCNPLVIMLCMLPALTCFGIGQCCLCCPFEWYPICGFLSCVSWTCPCLNHLLFLLCFKVRPGLPNKLREGMDAFDLGKYLFSCFLCRCIPIMTPLVCLFFAIMQFKNVFLGGHNKWGARSVNEKPHERFLWDFVFLTLSYGYIISFIFRPCVNSWSYFSGSKIGENKVIPLEGEGEDDDDSDGGLVYTYSSGSLDPGDAENGNSEVNEELEKIKESLIAQLTVNFDEMYLEIPGI